MVENDLTISGIFFADRNAIFATAQILTYKCLFILKFGAILDIYPACGLYTRLKYLFLKGLRNFILIHTVPMSHFAESKDKHFLIHHIISR